MAIKVKDSKTGVTQSIEDLVAKMQSVAKSEHKVQVASKIKYPDMARLPTGIYGLDYMTGGGLPKGKMSMFWGPKSSGKTMALLCAIAQAQLEDPNGIQVLADIEDAFDPEWVAWFGIDMDRLIIVQAETSEEYVDMCEALIMADNVNFLGVDSLAMLISRNELESSADKQAVGGSSAVVGKLMRKMTARLSALRSMNRYPTVVMINQMRMKIGVMFGNPETMPGGNALEHMLSLLIRFYGKDEMDLGSGKGKAVIPDLPAWKGITATIKKKKVVTLSAKAEYKQCIAPTADGHYPGEVPEMNYVINQLKNAGLHRKEGNKYYLFEEEYDKAGDIIAALQEDPLLYSNAKKALIELRKTELANAKK